MKRMKYFLVAVTVALTFSACEKDLEPYQEPTCRLNFLYGDWNGGYNTTDNIVAQHGEDYNLTNYSFYYEEMVPRDTLWFRVGTMGFLSDRPRILALRQIIVNDTLDNAEAGVDYGAFDSPEYKSFYQVPANTDTLSIPVILLNNEALENKTVTLCFGFADNGVFEPGYEEFAIRIIHFTAKADRPSGWMDGLLGTWGPVKHQLIIEWTGEKWDNEYIKKKYEEDYPYLEYMNQWLHYKLEEENTKRLADPNIGDVYREADGTEIEIPLYR